MTRWGIVATVKAPLREIAEFAAHHLDAGAHRLFLYLDDPDADTVAALSHPKLRVTACDDAFWARHGKRPAKHQVRQARNATRAYRRQAGDLDWLAHIDVDEFLWPPESVGQTLAALPGDALCARVRPVESVAGDGRVFKGFIPNGPERRATVDDLYPKFGRFLKGGFLSHVAGKLFVRTGLPEMTIRIHNAFRGDEMNPGQVELDALDLCHVHAKPWEDWLRTYRYRLEKGSYRAELSPAAPDTLTLHDMLSALEAKDGIDGLRAFHAEVAEDSPDLRARLDQHGLLRLRDLDLAAKRRKHFPDLG
jgi:hypothetical protein